MDTLADKKSNFKLFGLTCFLGFSLISVGGHCTTSDTYDAPAFQSEALKVWPNSELRDLLHGYNYVLKTSAAGAIESLIVSGENGSGRGNQIADASSASNAPTLPSVGQTTPLSLKTNLQGQDAIDALGANLPAIASEHGMTADRLREILLHDVTAWIDVTGRLYYVEAPPGEGEEHDHADAPVSDEKPPIATATMDLSKTFLLHSKPGATKIIYLDFNGQTVTGTGWNNSYSIPTISATAFDTGGDANVFDDNELTRIQNIWSRVSEDYAPFDIDVTTEEPAAEALDRSSTSDQAYGTRAIITKKVLPCSCGGIAYVGVFDYTSSYYKPAWIFFDMLGSGNEKYVAEAISHEVGHNLGLSHDGGTGTSYYQGHGSGATGWAPIMGVGYYRELVQWSKGEYSGANNQEDDISILQSNGATIRADDAGDTAATAAPLSGTLSGGVFAVNQSGIIERQGDADVYVFSTFGGPTTLSIAPAAFGPNLDVSAALHNAEGTLLAASNPSDTLSASISTELASGTYYLQIRGSDKAANGSDYGYSDYGSLGQYQISGQFAQGQANAPSAAASASATSGVAPLDIVFSSSSSTDDGIIVSYNWDFGDGSSSTDPNPSHIFATSGSFAVKLTVTDNAGLSSDSTLVVSVNSPGDATALHVQDMEISLNEKLKKVRAKVQVQVKNGAGQAVPNVVLTGKWAGLVKGKAKAVTDTSGIANLVSPAKAKRKGTFTFSVNGASLGGYTYNPAENTATSISITR